MAGDLEAELRARFTVREEAFAHGEWRVGLVLPRAADELIDPGDFDRDERLPYWADLWPSARALARHLLEVEYDAAGGALELGCGVALPSLALRGRGVDVLATDWYADALRFAEANAARNGLAPLRTALLDWRHPPAGERYSLVVAADVLYEQRNAEALAALLPRITTPGGTVLVADPGRVYARGFRNEMTLAGWSVREVDVREEPSAPAALSRVRVHRLIRATG